MLSPQLLGLGEMDRGYAARDSVGFGIVGPFGRDIPWICLLRHDSNVPFSPK
jgi:hypothetical protein